MDAREGSVSFALQVKAHGLEPILMAAYLLTDRSYARLEGDRKRSLLVTLRPKGGAAGAALPDLARAFARELETQKVRWALARHNLPIREYLAEQAVLLANGRGQAPAPAAAQPPQDQLNDEQRREIERLIAEVEAEIKAMGDKKAAAPGSGAADPKGITASWEEKQEASRREGKP